MPNLLENLIKKMDEYRKGSKIPILAFHQDDFNTLNTETKSLLVDIDFSHVSLLNVDFGDYRLRNITFNRSALLHVNFKNSKLKNVAFTNCYLIENTFDGVDLTKSVFRNIRAVGAKLKNVKMYPSQLIEFYRGGASQFENISLDGLEGVRRVLKTDLSFYYLVKNNLVFYKRVDSEIQVLISNPLSDKQKEELDTGKKPDEVKDLSFFFQTKIPFETAEDYLTRLRNHLEQGEALSEADWLVNDKAPKGDTLEEIESIGMVKTIYNQWLEKKLSNFLCAYRLQQVLNKKNSNALNSYANEAEKSIMPLSKFASKLDNINLFTHYHSENITNFSPNFFKHLLEFGYIYVVENKLSTEEFKVETPGSIKLISKWFIVVIVGGETLPVKMGSFLDISYSKINNFGQAPGPGRIKLKTWYKKLVKDFDMKLVDYKKYNIKQTKKYSTLVKLVKVSKLTKSALILIGKSFLSVGYTLVADYFTSGIFSVISYSNFPLDTKEFVDIYFRKLAIFLPNLKPHSPEVEQYLMDKFILNTNAEVGVKFLEKSSFSIYASGQGVVSKVIRGRGGKEELKRVPGYAFIDLAEVISKKYYVDRETPDVPENTKLICGPINNVYLETASYFPDGVQYNCQKSFAIQINDVKNDDFVYIDLSYINSGTVVGSQTKKNFFDASNYNELITLRDNNLFFNASGKHINVSNMDFFIGSAKHREVIRCDTMSESELFVISQGGGESYDLLYDCPRAKLNGNMVLRSKKSGLHLYELPLDPGKIYFWFGDPQAFVVFQLKLTLSDLMEERFYITENEAEDKKTIKIRDAELIIYPNTINPIFLDSEGHKFIPIINENETEVNSFVLLEASNEGNLFHKKIENFKSFRSELTNNKTLTYLLNFEMSTNKEKQSFLYVDEIGKSWIKVDESNEENNINFIPFLSEGSHIINRLQAEVMQKLAIFSASDIVSPIYHQDNLILCADKTCILLLDGYKHPEYYETLNITNIKDKKSYFGGDDVETYAAQAVPFSSLVQESIYYSFDFDIDFKRKNLNSVNNYALSNYTYEVRSKSAFEIKEIKCIHEHENHRRVLKLENFKVKNITTDALDQTNNNLILFITDDKNNKITVVKENWKDPSCGIDSIMADNYEVNGLSRFSSHEKLSLFFRDSLLIAEIEQHYVSDSYVWEDLKAFVGFQYDKLDFLDRNLKPEKIFGFENKEDYVSFLSVYVLDGSENKWISFFDKNPVLGMKMLLAFWVAARIRALPEGIPLEKFQTLFPMLSTELQTGLEKNLQKVLTSASSDISSLEKYIEASIAAEQEKVLTRLTLYKKEWQEESIQADQALADDPVSQDQAHRYITTEEQMIGDQPGDRYEMLGDQPANRFIPGESYATYSNKPPQISVDSSSSPSGINNITGVANVNATLLAADVIVRNITGNKYSSSIPNLSIERQQEARQQALMLTVAAALEKKWEQPESETSAGGFWNNWTTRIATIAGGLTAGTLSLAGIVAFIYCSRKKNLTTNDNEVENGITRPLNPSNTTNNVGNDKYSLNSIPANERTTLFARNDEQEGGSDASANFSFPMNDSFVQNSDWHVKIKRQKNDVKRAQEQVV